MAANFCYTCLLRIPFPWLAAVGGLIAVSQSQGFGVLTTFLTSSVLILCPVLLCRSKPSEQKQAQTEESNTSLQEGGNDDTAEEAVAVISKQQTEEITTGDELLVNSSVSEVLLSDNESVDHTTSSEDYSENDSIFRENLCHSTNYSDGSISDEESLIEIVLPTGHYDCSSHQLFQRKWPDYPLQSHFRQQNWMEMQNEMNEENFIEIDLCMGSIKCSRFEIKA